MEIIIKGSPEEIAALVVAILERQIDIAEEGSNQCLANQPLLGTLATPRGAP